MGIYRHRSVAVAVCAQRRVGQKSREKNSLGYGSDLFPLVDRDDRPLLPSKQSAAKRMRASLRAVASLRDAWGDGDSLINISRKFNLLEEDNKSLAGNYR